VSEELTLSEVSDGDTVRVVAIHGGKHVQDRLRSLGIRPGVAVKKVSGLAKFGPTVVRCGRTQTALGNGISRKILVEACE